MRNMPIVFLFNVVQKRVCLGHQGGLFGSQEGTGCFGTLRGARATQGNILRGETVVRISVSRRTTRSRVVSIRTESWKRMRRVDVGYKKGLYRSTGERVQKVRRTYNSLFCRDWCKINFIS